MIDSDALKTIVLAIVSMFSYLVGEVAHFIAEINFMPFVVEEGIVDIILQRGARTVAMMAGVVAIINGFKAWSDKRKSNRKK